MAPVGFQSRFTPNDRGMRIAIFSLQIMKNKDPRPYEDWSCPANLLGRHMNLPSPVPSQVAVHLATNLDAAVASLAWSRSNGSQGGPGNS